MTVLKQSEAYQQEGCAGTCSLYDNTPRLTRSRPGALGREEI